MLTGPVYLVRHGRYDTSTEGLTPEGLEIDAPRALGKLLTRGIGKSAVILSSYLPRAMQTAEVIAQGLDTTVIASRLIKEGGNRVRGVKDLDQLIERAVMESAVQLVDGDPLVVVTHAPMVAYARGIYGIDGSDRIRYGEVFEYEPGTWQNPRFDPRAEI